MMRRVEFSASREKTINIIFPYDVRVIDIVKKIEGRKFDPIKKLWYAKPIASNIDSILGLASYGFAIDKDVVVALKSMQEQKAQNIIGSQASTAEFEVEGLGGELMPFQKAGVMYASRVKRCLLGDEMGLGKSIQALATIHNLQTYPAIIVCPASLKYNWEKEAKKWLPTKTIQVITSKTKALTADITILNYDLLKKWLSSLSQLSAKAIIYDECHLIKSNSAARTKAAKVLSKNIPVRLGLSGTPILNRPQELVSQLTVLGRIDDLGGLWKFLQRYCNAVQTKWGWDMSGASNMEELNDK
ncbi:DEAD/DEAH box helicase family protein, partial [Patescibacteria group bacterium]|nr:DEAD/DEAH box helicase family protein [Patescibacteria group bacterium]